MPELPDIEGFRRVLARHGAGQRVQRVTVPEPDVLRNTSVQGLGRALKGRRLDEPTRHGKWLRAPTDGPAVLFHFGMTGELDWVADGEQHPHDRLKIVLDDGELRYRDQRKLQGVWLAGDEDEAASIMGPLGPDALDLTRQGLADLLAERRGQLKPALMDQEVIAGLGNLLTDEILWQARLNPSTRCKALDSDDVKRLHQVMRRVLRVSVKAGFVPPEDDWLTGARQAEEPRCPRCGSSLRQQQVGGRSSWSCPKCQPEPRT